MNFALVGRGKMGRAVEAQAAARGHRCVAVRDEPGGPAPRGDDLASADAVFEFTAPSVAEANVVALLEQGRAVVCGTTGWTPGAAVDRALESGTGALILAPNFSVGVQLFAAVVREAARLFGASGQYQVYVHEQHHRAKLDVPSGTARWLARTVVEADPRALTIHEGHPAEALPAEAVHVVGLRAGSEAGTHTVGFDGEHDQITLCHRSRARTGFALGAVLAAEWLVGRRGRHEFDEVLRDLVGEGGGR